MFDFLISLFSSYVARRLDCSHRAMPTSFLTSRVAACAHSATPFGSAIRPRLVVMEYLEFAFFAGLSDCCHLCRLCSGI